MTACGQGKKVGGAVADQDRSGARPAQKRGRIGGFAPPSENDVNDRRRLPWLVELLRLQDLADRIADRHQLADDADMLVRNAFGAASLADGDGRGRAVDHLHQRGVLCDEVAALADRITFGNTLYLAVDVVLRVEIDRLRGTVIDGFRKEDDRVR